MVLGITGLSGSGKNEAAAFFIDHGYFPIDVDVLGHQALDIVFPEVQKIFPSVIVQGRVDRVLLGNIVFRDRKQMKKLEALTHPWIKIEVKRLVSQHRDAVINAALLFTMGFDELCGSIIVVHSRFWTRFRRIKKRKPMKTISLLRRMFFQNVLRYQKKSSSADIHTVANDGARDALLSTLNELANKEGWI